MESTKMLSIEQQAHEVFLNYSYHDMRPSVHFWRQLVAVPSMTPRILIPDTLVLNQVDLPILWLYTSKDGHIAKNTNVSLKDFINKITSYCSPNQLAAAVKRATSRGENGSGNDLKLFNSRFLHNLSALQLGDQPICLQKYIKSHGKHAFLCRTVYNLAGASESFVITNKKSFYDEEEAEGRRFIAVASSKSNIVRTTQGSHLKQTKKYLQEIVKYFRFHRGLHFTKLVGDFIKDESGNWWLVNIKAFQLQAPVVRDPERRKLMMSATKGDGSSLGQEDKAKCERDKEKYQKTKTCRYCEKVFLESELTHRLTRKMMLEMDRYLLHIGKDYEWLLRWDSATIDSHSLYQDLRTCERCYRLYNQIQSLMQVEGEFLFKLGFTLEKPFKELLMSLTNTQGLQQKSKQKQIGNLLTSVPKVIELGPNSNIEMHDDCPIRNDQIINRMYRYRVILYLHEIDEIPFLKSHLHYYLEYTLFNNKCKLKLDSSQLHNNTLGVRKLRVCYIFANSNEDVQSYIAAAAPFQIFLAAEHRQTGQKRTIGYLKVDFKEFFNVNSIRKSIYKFFSVEDVAYGWGLEASVGIERSTDPVNTSRLIFSTEEKLIYLPHEDYCYCEYLPEEWMEEISKRAKGKPPSKPIDHKLSLENSKIDFEQTGHQFEERGSAIREDSMASTWQHSLLQQISSYESRALKTVKPK